MVIRFISLLALILAATTATGQPIRRADVVQNLVFQVQDENNPQPVLTRLDPTVALTLGKGQASHPQSTGGKTFTWRGTINIITPGKYQFSSTLLGALTVSIDGKPVFKAEQAGEAAQRFESAEVALEPGIQLFEATLTRTGPAVRAELYWRGPGFRSEPIPHFFFGHLPKQRPAELLTHTQRDHGRFLFEEMSCVRCHAAAPENKLAQGLTERAGPNLTDISKRAYPGWLDAWLANPSKLRPQTVMPQMFDETPQGKAERYAMVKYLTSLGGPLPVAKPATVMPNNERQSVDRGSKLFLTAGCAACHGDKLTQAPTKKINSEEEEEDPRKPEDWLHSHGTAGPTSYYLLGAVGSKTRSEPLAKFLQNPLATHKLGRMPNMQLSDQEAEDIARYLVRVTDDTLAPEMPAEPELKVDDLAKTLPGGPQAGWEKLNPSERWQRVGQKLFTTKGCINCHEMTGIREMRVATAFEKLPAAPNAGCLSMVPDVAKVPKYTLSDSQRSALTTFLKLGTSGAASPAPTFSARAAFKRFNCLNCHQRDGEGGIDKVLADMMKKLEKAENADDVQPPRLTGVGHKMRSSWMKEVLVNAGRARPWMTLRMPQYGPSNVEFLVEALPALEGTVTDDEIGKAEFTAEKLENGRRLAGKTGHGCISCHDISGITGGGTRGPDLATTNKRVRFEWYVRWMHQPQRMAPGTKMPQAFIDGKSLLDTIYKGDGDLQLEALWAYFSLGPGLPLPNGLEPPKGVIVSSTNNRPEIMRTFMPDNAGTKCIAVAYPNGVNLVFDSNRARLAYAWSGNFLDMTPAWVNRGGNQAKVLGSKFFTAPNGTPWAVTSSETRPDFDALANDPVYGAPPPPDRSYQGPLAVKFLGYSLDTVGTPSFKYKILAEKGVDSSGMFVRETSTPAKVTVAYGLTRSFALERPAGQTAWFNAGTAQLEPKVLTKTGSETWPDKETDVLVEGKMLLLPIDGGKVLVLQATAAPAGTTWHLAKSSRGFDVLLKLPSLKEAAVQELILNQWSLPKDDPKLLEGLK